MKDRPLAERRPDAALTPADLRKEADSATMPDATVATGADDEPPVGQERALEALELGLALRAPGYHVYVSGLPGTGRTTTVRHLLDRLAPTLPAPPDRAYVRRFGDPDRPRLLTAPAGTLVALAQTFSDFRQALRTRVPTLLEDRELERRRETVRERYAKAEQSALEALQARLHADGLGLVSVQAQPGVVVPEIVAVKDDQPLPLAQYLANLPEGDRATAQAKVEAYAGELREIFRASRDNQREFAKELRALVADSATALVDAELAHAKPADDDARAFVAEARADAVELIVELAERGPEGLEAALRRIERYRVNVLADRGHETGAPVVFEQHPSEQNLIGSIERVQEGPFAWRADASTIRGGSLLRADGGFLVLQAQDLLQEPGAWQQLKRALKTGQLEIGAALPGIFGMPRPLQPDPIRIDVKAVLIGERRIYDLLYSLDPDFVSLFAVRADFASDMPRSDASLEHYAIVLGQICAREGLPPIDRGALAAIVEHGAELTERRDRLTAQFGQIANLLREAAFWAGKRGSAKIEEGDVDEALRRRRERDGLIEDRLQDMLEEGSLLVATSGRKVGQVNGLSVYHLGYHAFGKPTRITASAAPGGAGIINIEREASLSGSIYDKGVLIISGFLRRRFADIGPLSLTASLAFEQSYAGVDGDSASIAEVVALCSELTGFAADQAIAITGSINQHGEVQPVGGVNHKLTGFFELCKARGLDGSHGAILPVQNVRDLMLPEEIVAASRAGTFHVFAVSHVEQALEIALDRPIASIDEAMRARLMAFAEALQGRTPDQPPSAAVVTGPQRPMPGGRPPGDSRGQ